MKKIVHPSNGCSSKLFASLVPQCLKVCAGDVQRVRTSSVRKTKAAGGQLPLGPKKSALEVCAIPAGVAEESLGRSVEW